MKIGMFLDQKFYGDLRVENEVQALVFAGFNVTVFCFTFEDKFREDDYFGATIVHIPVSKNIVFKLRGLTNTIINIYPYYLVKLVKPYIIKHGINILHIHDLYLFEFGLKIKKAIKDITLVGDLHENYVEGLKHYKFANTFPGKYLISIKKWERSEINWCNQYDYLITVIEEAVERYVLLGINRDKFHIVSNYVNIETFKIENINETVIKKFENFNTLIYVGGFDLHRGLESTIRAVPGIIKKVKRFKLILVGEGKNSGDLKNLAKKLKVEEHVSFEGWQPHDLLPSYIKASKVCLIPHLKTNHTDNTIPHKLFQYMLLKKPLLVSNCNPIERIVNETKTGLIFESNNSNHLAEKAIQLFSNDDELTKMGEYGYAAVKSKYNWNETSKNLIKLYDKIRK